MDGENPIPFDIEPIESDASRRDMSRHTLTIKQASQVFATLGVPRSPRSVQRFCEVQSIDSIRVRGEKSEQYFISQPSVERYAQELKQLEHISRIQDDTLRHDAPQRDIARHDAARRDNTTETAVPAPTAETIERATELEARVKVLENETFQLKIDRSAKEQVIGHMLDERRAWIEQITQQSRKIGQLEMQMQQLAAPQRDIARHDASRGDNVTDTGRVVAEVNDQEERDLIDAEPSPSSPLPTSSPEQKLSIWTRIFR